MRRKLVSILLTLALVLTSMPLFGLTVFGAEMTTKYIDTYDNLFGTCNNNEGKETRAILRQDIEMPTDVNDHGTLILDLNGHTLKITGGNCHINTFADTNLTITGGGVIDTTEVDYRSILLRENANVTIENCTIIADTKIFDGNSTFSGIVNINSGKYITTYDTLADTTSSLSPLFQIKGGYFESADKIWNCPAADTTKVDIYKGTFLSRGDGNGFVLNGNTQKGAVSGRELYIDGTLQSGGNPDVSVAGEGHFYQVGYASDFASLTFLAMEHGSMSLDLANTNMPNGSKILKRQELPLNITIDEGYAPTGDYEISGDVTVAEDNRQFFISINGDVTIKALLINQTRYYLTDASDSTKGTITFNPTRYAYEGNVIEFAPNPKDGYAFKSITITDELGNQITPTDASHFVMPAGDVTVTGEFVAGYKVYALNSYYGTFTVDKTLTYGGDTVTITPTPEAGYRYAGTEIYNLTNGDLIETLDRNTTTFTMPNEAVRVQAKFEVIPTYTVTIGDDFVGGTLTLSKTSAKPGEWVTCYYTEDIGYAFSCVEYKVGDGEYTRVNGRAFIMPEGDVVVRGIFSEQPKYDITCATVENGTVETDVERAYAGQTVEVSASAASGEYQLASITVTDADGNNVTVNGSNCFVMPAKAVTVSASFAKIREVEVNTFDELVAQLASTSPSIITVGQDIAPLDTEEDYFTVLGKHYLDLDGHTVDLKKHTIGVGKAAAYGVNLTVRGNGTIITDTSVATSMFTVYSGRLVIENGTFIQRGEGKVVNTQSAQSMTPYVDIYGGYFESRGLVAASPADAYDTTRLTVYGGTFLTLSEDPQVGAFDFYNNSNKKVAVGKRAASDGAYRPNLSLRASDFGKGKFVQVGVEAEDFVNFSVSIPYGSFQIMRNMQLGKVLKGTEMEISYTFNDGFEYTGCDSANCSFVKNVDSITATIGDANADALLTINSQREVAVPVGQSYEVIGREIVAFADNDDYTVTGQGAASEIGDYQAVLSLTAGRVWADGTTEDKTINWSIVRVPAQFVDQPQNAQVANGQDYQIAWSVNYAPSSVKLQAYDEETAAWKDYQAATATGTKVVFNDEMANKSFKLRAVAVIDEAEIVSNEFTLTWAATSPTHTVTTLVEDPAMGTVTESVTVNDGDQVTVKATPNPGYKFVKWWKKVGDLSEPKFNLEYTETVYTDVKWTAIFEKDMQKVQVFSNGNGVATPSRTTADERYWTGDPEPLVVTATPDEHYEFDSWIVSGIDEIPTTATFTVPLIKLTQGVSYIAHFEKIKYNITASAEANGSVSGAGKYTFDEDITLTAIPNACYAFDYWTKDGVKLEGEGSVITFRPEADANYVAHFKLVSHSFTNYVSNGDATCTADGTKTAKCDRCEVTDTVVDAGSALGHVEGDWIVHPATMTTSGERIKECTRCQALLDAQYYAQIKTVKLSATKYTYNGKVRNPAVNVYDLNGKKLVKGTDYTVTNATGRKLAGKYKVTVKFQGNYKGTKTLYFTINPAVPGVKSITAGTRSLKLTMASKPSAKGASTYQIAYRVKGTKTWKYTTTTSATKTIKSLKKGKVYQVRIRAYKTVNKVKYYSNWTAIKTTKKIK